jgi:hypothetical protein
MIRVAILLALLLGGCAVSPAPQTDLSPMAVRTAWLSKGHYVWQPLVSDEPAVPEVPTVRHVKLTKKEANKGATTPVATQRVLACDLGAYRTGCETY